MVSQSELRRLLEYDENLPSCFRWIGAKRKTINGKMAGSERIGGGIYYIKIGGKYYNTALLSWIYHNGEPQEGQHILKLQDESAKISNLVRVSDQQVKESLELQAQGNFKDLFLYSEGKLFWKQNQIVVANQSYRFGGLTGEQVHATKTGEGYFQIALNGSRHSLHRVIWEVVHDTIPEGFEVDHLDGDRSNNSTHNLRLVTRATNNKNQATGSNNKSGFKGVCLCGDYWVASWYDLEGVYIRKNFSTKRYGYEKARELAVQARKEAVEYLNQCLKGEGYTKRHMQSQEV